MRSVILALAIATMAGGTAHAAEPQSSFQTTHAKSQVPVTPKQTISTANRKAGLSFNSDGTLKTRKLPSGQTVGDAKKATGK
jgi:hypothetical protein